MHHSQCITLQVRLGPAASAIVELHSSAYSGSCAFCSFQDGHEDANKTWAARKGKYRVIIGDGGHMDELTLVVNVV
jgi:hypothetical protein